MQIDTRVFLISGGASGLGLAAARALTAQGGRVVLADIHEGDGRAAAEALGEAACFVRCDVTVEGDVRQAVAAARERFGALHGVVSCAGVASGEKLLGRNGPHGLESFRRVVEINLVGTFNLLRLGVEAMTENPPNEEGERGVVITAASVAAFDGQIGQAAYSASKSGVVGMTLPAARELARHGIRVMCIAPGVFETPMMAGMTQEVRDSLAANVPFPPRLGRPQEFAALVRHIVENPMLNGEVIRLDGALRMSAK